MKRLITLVTFCCLFFTYARAQYCTPTYQICDEKIDSVILNTINKRTLSTDCGSTSMGYSDFSALSTTLITGVPYILTVGVGPSYQGDSVDVWIDYNHNNTFDANELVKTIGGYWGTFTGVGRQIATERYMLTLPTTTPTGSTRMRLRLRYGSSNQLADPCAFYQYGETEDYTVNIVSTGTSCSGIPQAPVLDGVHVYSGGSPDTSLPCLGDSVALINSDPNNGTGIVHIWQRSAHINGPWTNIGAGDYTYYAVTTNDTVYYRVYDSCASSAQVSAFSNAYMVIAGGQVLSRSGTHVLCAGGSASFNVSVNGAVSNYQWQVNAGAGFINLNNSTTYAGVTTDTLKITNANTSMNGYIYQCMVTLSGCAPPRAVGSDTLIVSGNPVITMQPASSAVCPGSNASFSLTASNAAAYQWQVNTGSGYTNITNNSTYSGATTASLSITTATPAMNGYTYRCIVSGNCLSLSVSSEATLSSGFTVPTLSVSGNTTYCQGDNFSLSVPPAYAVYQWYKGAGIVSGATGAVYTPVVSGNYHVKVSSAIGCNGNSDTVSVTVKPAPEQPNVTATGDTIFCLGSGVLLVSDVISGLPTQWLLNNGVILGGTGLSYNATDSGYYAIQVTGPNGCTATSVPVHTSVYELPLPVVVPTGHFGMCVANSSFFTSYQWYNNGQAIAGATSSCYTATADGSYSVSGTDDLSCSKMSFPMVLSNVGVNNIPAIQEAVKVYPNPASSVVMVEAPVMVSLSVSSIDGRVMYYEKNVKAMDISSLAPGVYMLSVYDEQNTVLKIVKLVKE